MERSSRIEGWLREDLWPVPKWVLNADTPDRVRNFESLSAQHLRARYVELESDFLTVVENFSEDIDIAVAASIFRYLHWVRPALERRSPQLISISNTLDLVERSMVWLYPLHFLPVRVDSTIVRLKLLRPVGWIDYVAQLQPESGCHPRAALDEAIGACNRHVFDLNISNNLQIRRLRTYRNWSMLIILVLLYLMPSLLGTIELDQPRPLPGLDIIKTWLPALDIVLVGMLGGFVSGLLQVRSTRVHLIDYQESMLKLSLRPLLGGIVALVLCMMLSWKLIPGVEVDKFGVYLFAAFLSGFSERYFLRFIDTAQQSTQTSDSSALSYHSNLPPSVKLMPEMSQLGETPAVKALGESGDEETVKQRSNV